MTGSMGEPKDHGGNKEPSRIFMTREVDKELYDYDVEFV